MRIDLPVDIVFCNDLSDEIAKYCVTHKYNSICIVTGSKSAQQSGLLEKVKDKLDGQKISSFSQSISSEPESNAVDLLAKTLTEKKVSAIIALGGGSVIDASKSAALQAANGKDFADIEFNTNNLTEAIPVVAAPTVSGSGSETTPYSVINNSSTGRKSTIFHKSIFPQMALICPQEHIKLSARQTAAGAFDTLIHCFEAYTSTQGSEVVNLFATRGANLVFKNINKVLSSPEDTAGRKALAEASMLGGAAIAHVRTGIIHTLSVALQKYSNLPHGLLNAAIAPYAIQLNEQFYSGKLESFLQESAFILKNNTTAAAQFSNWFTDTYQIDGPSFEVPDKDLGSVIERFKQDKGLLEVNPAPLSDESINKFIKKVIYA